MEQESLSFLLAKYFTIKGTVALPGIGVISRHYISASFGSGRTIEPPSFQFAFDNLSDSPTNSQLSYLSGKSGNSKDEVIDSLRQLGQDILYFLQTERRLDWSGIGVFQKDDDGFLSFQAKTVSTQYFESKESIEVEQPVLFNEDKKIDIQTEADEERFEQISDVEAEPVTNSGRKFIILIILICIAIFSFRFFMGHFDLLGPTSQKIHPVNPSATFKQF